MSAAKCVRDRCTSGPILALKADTMSVTLRVCGRHAKWALDLLGDFEYPGRATRFVIGHDRNYRDVQDVKDL